MPKIVCLISLLIMAVSLPVYSKDKDTSLEGVIEDVFKDDDHPGKGHGRPDNPGEHGRENAADKQSRGHGKGSKGDDSWVDQVKDHVEDDDKGKGNKNKKK